VKKLKRPLSICVAAFPSQFAQLRPENGKAGGVKSRSQPQAVREAVYAGINELYAAAHPYCNACHKIWPQDPIALKLHFRDDTHQTRGKDGLLYFDVRWFLSACRRAHQWIGEHPKEARELGLLCDEGQWNIVSR
jgi:hypothetical protein